VKSIGGKSLLDSMPGRKESCKDPLPIAFRCKVIVDVWALKWTEEFTMWHNKPFILFFFVVIAVSYFVIFLGWKTTRFYGYLLENGTCSKAWVVDYSIEPGLKGGENHYFKYRYSDAKGHFYDSRITRNKPSERFKVGQVIDVVYDPVNPNQNVPFLITSDLVYQPLKQSFIFALSIIGGTALFGALACSELGMINIDKKVFKRLLGIGGQ
jgi:hypothetical protein